MLLGPVGRAAVRARNRMSFKLRVQAAVVRFSARQAIFIDGHEACAQSLFHLLFKHSVLAQSEAVYPALPSHHAY